MVRRQRAPGLECQGAARRAGCVRDGLQRGVYQFCPRRARAGFSAAEEGERYVATPGGGGGIKEANGEADLCGAIEDLSEEEKKAEAAPIVAQEVYVLMRMGRVEDAVSRSAELDVEKWALSLYLPFSLSLFLPLSLSPSLSLVQSLYIQSLYIYIQGLTPPSLADTALRLIATNNEISAISRLPSYNPHTALKAAADAASSSSSSSTARPFRFQSRSLEQNSAILDLQVGKLNAVKAAASKRASTDPTDPINGVLHAAAAVAPAGNPTGKEAQTKITKLLSASPHDIGLALTLTQLQIQRTNLTGALQTLGTLTTSLPPAQRFQPGLVGLQVALHQHLGQKAHTKSLLHAASTFWRTAASSPDPALLRAAASAQLDSTEPADLLIAGSLFADLLAANPADTLAACGLVAAYATTDPARITPQHLAALPDVERLIADIDAAALEAGGVAVQPRGKRAADDDDDDGTARPRERVKKVRRKKTKVPALLVGKTPDAERWLPVRDRSSYRPKGKKGKKAVGATQGGVVVAEAEADATKEVKKVVGPGGGGGAGKKKKKKAGKR